VTGYRTDIASRVALAVLMATVAIMASSCGDDGDTAEDRREIRAAFAGLNKRVAERDLVGICRSMARSAQRQVGSIGHGEPSTCENDVRKFLKSIEDDPRSRPIRPRIARMSIDGDRATVIADYEPGDDAGAFRFEREDGRWKLGLVFSTTATAPYDLGTTVKGLPSLGVEDTLGPRLTTLPVSAEGRAGGCSPVDAEGLELFGGCELTVDSSKVRFRLKTLFGDSPFATCEVSFTMHVDSAGRIGLGNPGIGYSSGISGGPCGDIQACRTRSSGPSPWNYKRPWRGRIRSTADRQLVAEIDLCFDSCAGRLQGRTTIPMTRGGRGWRLEADDVPVGRSGLSVGGTWPLTPDRLRIASPPNPQASS
jgi:hypothetical protein